MKIKNIQNFPHKYKNKLLTGVATAGLLINTSSTVKGSDLKPDKFITTNELMEKLPRIKDDLKLTKTELIAGTLGAFLLTLGLIIYSTKKEDSSDNKF